MIYLRISVLVRSTRFVFLKSEFLKPVLKRPERQAEQLGRFCDVIVGTVHRLHYQAAFDVLEIDALGRKLELRVAVDRREAGALRHFWR